MEGRQVGHVGRRVLQRVAETLGNQDLDPAPQDRGEFREAELGMVLHAPEGAAVRADLGGLDVRHGIRREHRAIGRRGCDDVEVDRRRIVGGGAPREHRMRPPRLGRHDPPREADLGLRIPAHVAARRGRADLQAPARAEGGRAGRVDGAHEVDLAGDFRRRVVDVERRARQHHPVMDWSPPGSGRLAPSSAGKARSKTPSGAMACRTPA